MDFFENQWVEVFRVGKQTDSAGNTDEWTKSDLDKIVSNYNTGKHEAPVVIGHPKENAPAFGWVEELKADGNMLYAKFKQLIPEFVDAVSQGLYKKRSISLYPDLTLRHVGFLGAMPPAVKGLADIKFNANEELINIDFEENLNSDTKEDIIDNSTKTEIKDLRDTSKGDKKVSEDLKKQKEELEKKLEKAFSENQKLAEKVEEAQKKSNFAEEAEGRLKQIEAQLEAEKRKNRIAEFKEYVNKLHNDGKIVTDTQNVVIDLMEALNGVGNFNFSDGSKPALDKFKTYLEAQPQLVNFNEELVKKDKRTTKTADEQLNALALDKAKEKNISFSEAMGLAQLANPDLAQAAAIEMNN